MTDPPRLPANWVSLLAADDDEIAERLIRQTRALQSFPILNLRCEHEREHAVEKAICVTPETGRLDG
jgi:hypothetical protein